MCEIINPITENENQNHFVEHHILTKKKHEEDLVKLYKFLFQDCSFVPYSMEIKTHEDYSYGRCVQYNVTIISPILGITSSTIRTARLITEFEALFNH